MAMMLFDAAPFHIVLLPSVTSSDFEKINGKFLTGGFDEGRQLFAFAKYLQSNAFREHSQVSRVHIMGMSLGGLSTQYAGLYNSFESKSDGTPYVTSLFAGCSVIDLRKATHSLFRPTLPGRFLFRETLGQIFNVVHAVPILGRILPQFGGKPSMDEMPRFIAKLGFETYRELTQNQGWGTAPLQDLRIQSPEDFWNASNFKNYAQLSTSPTLMWTARDDTTVTFNDNIDPLIQIGANGQASPLQAFGTDSGGHCDFMNPYGWDLTSKLVASYFVSQSPELKEVRSRHRVAVNFGSSLALKANYHESIGALSWKAAINSSHATLSATISGTKYVAGNSHDPLANQYRPYRRKVSLTFDLRALGVLKEGRSVPALKAEAEALTRWLNTNLWLLDKNGNIAQDIRSPTSLEWMSY
jgi:hypothetical protein